MRILVFGASGMLGHSIMNCFGNHDELQLIGTTTNLNYKTDITSQLLYFNYLEDNNIDKFLLKYNPDIIINSLGVVKQNKKIDNKLDSLYLNSIFPNLLAKFSLNEGIRYIHISTDCVFSGIKGDYVENDKPDTLDFYGTTKLLGESLTETSLIIRTSLIGHELFNKYGLLEWFLNERDKCLGFSNAFFSGFTTNQFSQILKKIILEKPNLNGIYHVSSNKISKYDLLLKIKKIYKKKIEIINDTSFVIDRSLDGSRFNSIINLRVPSWDEMIKKMYDERFSDV